MKMWTLDDGLKLVKALQDRSRNYGYHLTLGGSVLNYGKSDRDIDLYFIPVENSDYPKDDPHGLIGWLEGMWGVASNIGDYGKKPPPPPYRIFGVRAVPDFLAQEPAVDEGAILVQPQQEIDEMPKHSRSVYKYKLKFIRNAGDRVDAFIL